MLRHLAVVGALATLTAGGLEAQGWIQDVRPFRPIPVGAPPTVVRVSSTVRTAIEGRIARVEVEEQFRNTGGGLAEGTYLYPLPGDAVFSDFSLWMGETKVQGEVMSAEPASSPCGRPAGAGFAPLCHHRRLSPWRRGQKSRCRA